MLTPIHICIYTYIRPGTIQPGTICALWFLCSGIPSQTGSCRSCFRFMPVPVLAGSRQFHFMPNRTGSCVSRSRLLPVHACDLASPFRFRFMLVRAAHGSCRFVQTCAGADSGFGRFMQLATCFPFQRVDKSGPAHVAMSGLCQFRFIPIRAGSAHAGSCRVVHKPKLVSTGSCM